MMYNGFSQTKIICHFESIILHIFRYFREVNNTTVTKHNNLKVNAIVEKALTITHLKLELNKCTVALQNEPSVILLIESTGLHLFLLTRILPSMYFCNSSFELMMDDVVHDAILHISFKIPLYIYVRSFPWFS